MQNFLFDKLDSTQLLTNLSAEVGQASGYEMWTGFDSQLRQSLHDNTGAFPLHGTDSSSFLPYGERFYSYYAPAFLVFGMLFLAMCLNFFISAVYVANN
jgi:hypothetical protein